MTLTMFAEALDRTDDIFHVHKQYRAVHCERSPKAPTHSTITLPTPRQSSRSFNRSHPGPLTSNPPYGPPKHSPSKHPSLPPLPNNLSDMALSPAAFHTASSTSITSARPRAIQIPGRPRAAADAGRATEARAAANRTRAKSLNYIREATARRTTTATMPTTPQHSPF